MSPRLIGLDEMVGARQRIAPFVRRTPIVASAEGPLLKAETLQPCGAFKIRGAFNALLALSPEQRRRGVIAPSSGNHAQAVAYAAHTLGVPALAVMPHSSPLTKREGVRRWGAGLRLVEPGDANAWAQRHAEQKGLSLIHPFDTPEIIAATGTLGLEILDDAPALDCIFVPVSGGGLIAGVAAAVKAVSPRTRVVGVEPELADDARRSLAAGRPVEMPFAETGRTMADGLRVTRVGEFAFRHLQAFVDDLITVTEEEIADAVAWTAITGRLVAEPSGAAAVAGALKSDLAPGTALAIVSGGNVDPALFARLLQRAAGPRSA